MAMREYKTLTNRILYTLAMDALDLMDTENLIPTGTIIRENPDQSLYAIRKALKQLKDEGLIQSICVCYYGEDCEHRLIRGWRITDKARTTGIYADAKKDEMEIRREVFGSTFAGGKKNETD